MITVYDSIRLSQLLLPALDAAQNSTGVDGVVVSVQGHRYIKVTAG